MRSAFVRVSLFALGVVMMVGAVSATVLAGGVIDAPEIDGGSISAGLAAASAAVLMLRSRRRAK